MAWHIRLIDEGLWWLYDVLCPVNGDYDVLCDVLCPVNGDCVMCPVNGDGCSCWLAPMVRKGFSLLFDWEHFDPCVTVPKSHWLCCWNLTQNMAPPFCQPNRSTSNSCTSRPWMVGSRSLWRWRKPKGAACSVRAPFSSRGAVLPVLWLPWAGEMGASWIVSAWPSNAQCRSMNLSSPGSAIARCVHLLTTFFCALCLCLSVSVAPTSLQVACFSHGCSLFCVFIISPFPILLVDYDLFSPNVPVTMQCANTQLLETIYKGCTLFAVCCWGSWHQLPNCNLQYLAAHFSKKSDLVVAVDHPDCVRSDSSLTPMLRFM